PNLIRKYQIKYTPNCVLPSTLFFFRVSRFMLYHILSNYESYACTEDLWSFGRGTDRSTTHLSQPAGERLQWSA
ncbi:hypothetical protein BJV82DRAFT_625656, partial [Fennellomyces sp. T-0311]